MNEDYVNIRKTITLYDIENDTVASPWGYAETIDWYRKQIGYEPDEQLDVSLVDISSGGMWEYYKPEDRDLETALYNLFSEMPELRYLVIGDPNTKIGNITMHYGDLQKFISFQEYCTRYLKSEEEMKEPEIIASTDY